MSTTKDVNKQDMVVLTTTVPQWLADEIEAICEKTLDNKSAWIRRVLVEHVRAVGAA